MKVRNGFVSNSSSSSFCLGKNYMTLEQIRLFSEWLKNREEDSNIYEQKYYFLGELDHYDEELLDYLEKIGVDKEYIATC